MYLINAKTYGTALYSGLVFTSLYTHTDGKTYGTTAAGIFELSGDTDDGTEIQAVVGFGKLDFGAEVFKALPNLYVGAKSGDNLYLRVNGYEYQARSFDEDIKQQRFDLGRGLRANYFDIELYNMAGADFEVDTVSAVVVPSKRRI